jgi:hypothetical protein
VAEDDYRLDSIDRDMIRMALRGDVDMRRYAPEVMRLCARFGIVERPWLDDPGLAERVELNRAQWPRRTTTDRRSSCSLGTTC